MEKVTNERESVNILKEAIELQIAKGKDYNGSETSVQQADYYTYGVYSLLDTVHAKYLRMMSVLEQMEKGGKENFESVEDSAIDLINYASFIVAYVRGEVPGQDGSKDIFGKKVTENTPEATIPKKFKG